MSHEIAVNSTTGKHMVFTAGSLPWHELGQNVSEAVDWTEAIRLAELDWEVVKAPLWTNWSKAGLLSVASHVAVCRKDTKEVLGVVGKDYVPVQNAYAFEFTNTLLNMGAKYESAGGLGKGERIWCLARVPQADFTVGKKDKHETYLLFSTSHDGSMSVTVRLTDVRVVCNNTLNLALSRGTKDALKMRHTKNVEVKMEAAKALITDTVEDAKSLQEKLNKIANWKLKKESMKAILDRLFPVDEEKASAATITRRDNVLADILALYEKNDNGAFPEQRGTGYNLLNAITNYADHERTARITSGREGMTLQQARAQSAMFGTSDTLKAQALNVMVQMADGTYKEATGGDVLNQILNNTYQQ